MAFTSYWSNQAEYLGNVPKFTNIHVLATREKAYKLPDEPAPTGPHRGKNLAKEFAKV